LNKIKKLKMKRDIVTIDENLCNGCGDCVPACHEGALQIIDGKVRLVSDLMCDGLGACLGHCPQGAISIEQREAQPYDEVKVMAIMVQKGKNTVLAHLRHLKEHNEKEYFKQGIQFLKENADSINFNTDEVMKEIQHLDDHQHEGGCPGMRTMSFEPKSVVVASDALITGNSELRQWPVQMHLINPQAGYFQNADVLLAADCVAFALGGFHQKFLKGKSLAIACPKLDSGQDVYISKLKSLIDDARINTLHVIIMQVPCCGGLLQMAKIAAEQATRKVPIKVSVVGIEGDILSENWV
jgi:NAD-dependent dihydropyrimidine dehydrogenase PreA subunit